MATTVTSSASAGVRRRKSAEVEGRQGQPAGSSPLPHEHRGDDESGDDEEHVDADEATGDWQFRVERDDEEYGDRAQSLDVGSPAGRSGRRCGCLGIADVERHVRRSPLTTPTVSATESARGPQIWAAGARVTPRMSLVATAPTVPSAVSIESSGRRPAVSACEDDPA